MTTNTQTTVAIEEVQIGQKVRINKYMTMTIEAEPTLAFVEARGCVVVKVDGYKWSGVCEPWSIQADAGKMYELV